MSGSEPKSTRPSPPWWLLIVTLLGGAFMVQRANQSAEDKAAGTPPVVPAAATGETSAAEDRIQAPLREFLGLPVMPDKSATSPVLGKVQLENPLADGSRVKASAEWLAKASDREQDRIAELKKRIRASVGLLEFLVVTVADPIDTATNYRFDLQLDALHKALGADGYVPDHYYLPWGTPEKANAHRTEPGVLLYRRNGPSWCACEEKEKRTDLLVVYLIGETPTSGIQTEAFLAAVKQMEALRDLACPPKPPPVTPAVPPTIRIAGPLFTGAANSLALAIRRAKDDQITRADFQVITGTAVSIDQGRFQSLAGERVDLHSTVLSGTVLKNALIDHVLERTWSKTVRIAWLTETGTGYGSSISADQERATTRKKSRVRTEDATQDDSPQAEILEFRFPVNISRVRSSYVETRRRERSNQASLGPESSRLPIPFEDISTARDVPPMQTPKVTAPTVELILSQILTTIRNEGIKFVGISSSDPRDPIFLAEIIKDQCPDAQIMLVTSDVLHLHSEYRPIMHGTLVSSTHPLHPEIQDLCFPFREEQKGTSRSAVLSSQSNYGLYNAVLFLRGLERGQYTDVHSTSTDGKHEHKSADLIKLAYSDKTGWPGGLPLGYSLPFAKVVTGECGQLRPPVWISRISPTGIYPITVRATDDPYTLTLQIDEPPESPLLPKRQFSSRVPTSLYIAGMLWLVVAAIFGAALWMPKLVGNWAKALAPAKGQPAEFQSLIYVFRSYITGSLVYVVAMFANLQFAHDQWMIGVIGERDYSIVLQYLLGWGVTLILTARILIDWGSAFRSLANDLMGALKRLFGASAAATGTDLSWHLIAARGIGLAMIMTLVVIHVSATIWQQRAWGKHPDSFLWFKVTSDMWNGLSHAMNAQLLAMALIVLAYGMLLQMHLLSPEYTIFRPTPSKSTLLTEAERRKGREEVQNALLFPLLSRWQRSRPVVLDILCIAAALLWLGFLGWNLPSPDYCPFPVSFPSTLLLFASGVWCVRLFKLILILKGLSRHLEELTLALREKWPDSWQHIFEHLPEKRVGLQELFWASRPHVKELEQARREFNEVQTMDPDRVKAKQQLCAIEIELYVRQFFHHIVRLGFGLAASASLIFLCAQAFPYSQEPLLRLSASIMLASIGCVMAWYYLKFDRNELLSHMVGTDPKQVSINWSLIQMVAPAVLLTLVAVLSSTFPEIWQWVRGVLEPMARSSI